MRVACALAALPVVAASGDEAAPPPTQSESKVEQPISQAERLLFMSNHMERVAPRRRLHYAFRRDGSLEPALTDTVDVDVLAADGATGRSVKVRFLSKGPGSASPSLPHVEGNPALLLYLEREIREMARLTGGRPEYFQRRIRNALAEHAQISEATVTLAGHRIAARRIEIAPYVDDPNRSRFEKFARRSYVFTLSDDVPGVLYSIETRLPATEDAGKAGAMLLDEKMDFRGEQRVD